MTWQRIAALRCLEAALREWNKGSRPTAVNDQVLDAAVEIARKRLSADVAYRIAGQLKLPKEALAFLMQQAERTKDDVGRVVSDEVRKFLQSDRLRDEFLKMIAGMTIEVRAEVKLVPDRVKGESSSLMPRVQVSELKTKFATEKKKKKGEPDPSDEN